MEGFIIFSCLIGAILLIWIDYLVSNEFYLAAQAKGYARKKYFWICFLLGVIGYLLVIALPDRSEANHLTNDELPEL